MNNKIRPVRIEGQIAYVPLTKGYEALIDAADAHLVSQWNWACTVSKHPDGSVRTAYATRGQRVGRSVKTILMHRIIDETPEGFQTDHINGNGLDNRRANLRCATHNQNQHNSKTPINNTSGVKGVQWHKQRSKWQARITLGGKTRSLGLFTCLDEAKLAYQKASAELHGDFGRAA